MEEQMLIKEMKYRSLSKRRGRRRVRSVRYAIENTNQFAGTCSLKNNPIAIG